MLACGVLQPVQGMIEEMAIKIYTSVKSHCSVLLLCALLKTNFPAFAAAAENALDSTTFGPYVEVYPAPVDLSRNQLDCTPTNNETCPLYFALMMSFGGEYVSSGVIASVQYALDQINSDSDLLPGYSLHYTLTDSQVQLD